MLLKDRAMKNQSVSVSQHNKIVSEDEASHINLPESKSEVTDRRKAGGSIFRWLDDVERMIYESLK
jgi:hypothetical protein